MSLESEAGKFLSLLAVLFSCFLSEKYKCGLKVQHGTSSISIMVCRSSPLVLLAILTPVLCCDWLRDYRHLRNRTVVLLETMVSHAASWRGGCTPGD